MSYLRESVLLIFSHLHIYKYNILVNKYIVKLLVNTCANNTTH
nr:MAG TPA: hypothetical protein [Caudoviricetes sp.]